MQRKKMLKKNYQNIYIFIIFFLCSYNSVGQIDSIEKQGFYYLEKAKNTLKPKKDSIFYYLEKSRAIGVKHHLDSLLLKVTKASVYQYYRFRQYKKSYNYCLQLDTLSKKLNDSITMLYVQNSFGRLENNFDNSNKSNEHYKKAISIAHNINDNLGLSVAHCNIGINYMNLEQYNLAKPFVHESINYFQKLTKEIKEKNSYNLAMAYVNLVYIYTELKDKENAFLYLAKANKLLKNNYFEGAVEFYQLQGITYAGFFENKKAIDAFKKQLEVSKARNDKTTIEHALLNLAELHVKIKDYNNASFYFNIYEKSNAKDAGYDEILSDNKQIYTIGMDSYKGAKQYEKAFKYAELLNKTLDTLHKIEVNKTFAEFGVKYETEKKNKENELLKRDVLIKDLEVKKQTTYRNYIIIFSVMSLLTLAITYNRFRLKKKTANALANQNAIINNQKVELEKSNDNKQRLFGIIAHDLINPFNAILGYTKLLEEDYESFNEDQRIQFIKTINKYANNNYKLTRTLLDWAKIQQDRLVVNKATLNCKEIVTEAIQPYKILADKKNIQINTNISDAIFIEADKNMMQTVIGNLFVNAIKFTAQNGKINFSLKKNKNCTVKIEIEDNGIGMAQEELNNLFDITKVNTRQGTNKEKGNGLGLILSKELMELQKGTLQMFSEINKGSTAVLII